MSAKKKAVPSVRWVVVVSVTDPLTGSRVISKSHECRDVHHARTLLTEIREYAGEMEPFLPGIVAEGYELGETFSLTPQGQTALAAVAAVAEEAASGRTHDARWWAAALENLS